MLSFKDYFVEAATPKELPKNAKLSDVSYDAYSGVKGLPELSKADKAFWSKYITKVDDWIGGGERGLDAGPFLLKNKDRIPTRFRKSDTLYRGIYFDDWENFRDSIDIVESGILKKRGRKIDSWTTKFKIARDDFAKGSTGAGIVLNMKVPTNLIILCLREWVLDRSTVEIGATATKDEFNAMKMAKAEFEVLVESQDIKLSEKNVVWAHWEGDKIPYSEMVSKMKHWRNNNLSGN